MCNNNCVGKLCDNFILSQAITFAAGTLTVNIPAGSYANCTKYCLVLAQAIPAGTTIGAPVVITIGDGTVAYPLINRCGTPVTAEMVRTRRRYATTVVTTTTGGSFRLCGNIGCPTNANLTAIDGTAPVAAAEGGA